MWQLIHTIHQGSKPATSNSSCIKSIPLLAISAPKQHVHYNTCTPCGCGRQFMQVYIHRTLKLHRSHIFIILVNMMCLQYCILYCIVLYCIVLYVSCYLCVHTRTTTPLHVGCKAMRQTIALWPLTSPSVHVSFNLILCHFEICSHSITTVCTFVGKTCLLPHKVESLSSERSLQQCPLLPEALCPSVNPRRMFHRQTHPNSISICHNQVVLSLNTPWQRKSSCHTLVHPITVVLQMSAHLLVCLGWWGNLWMTSQIEPSLAMDRSS